jgi:hypothetical protein
MPRNAPLFRKLHFADFRQLGSYPETGFGEINGDVLEADFSETF